MTGLCREKEAGTTQGPEWAQGRQGRALVPVGLTPFPSWGHAYSPSGPTAITTFAPVLLPEPLRLMLLACRAPSGP